MHKYLCFDGKTEEKTHQGPWLELLVLKHV